MALRGAVIFTVFSFAGIVLWWIYQGMDKTFCVKGSATYPVGCEPVTSIARYSAVAAWLFGVIAVLCWIACLKDPFQ